MVQTYVGYSTNIGADLAVLTCWQAASESIKNTHRFDETAKAEETHKCKKALNSLGCFGWTQKIDKICTT